MKHMQCHHGRGYQMIIKLEQFTVATIHPAEIHLQHFHRVQRPKGTYRLYLMREWHYRDWFDMLHHSSEWLRYGPFRIAGVSKLPLS
jgi:hypothetical protein